MYEQNEDELRRQIMLRSQRKPLIGNEQTAGVARGMANAGQLLFGGRPQFKEVEPESGLDTAIKMNQLQTGSPEFKMQEAQTRADIDVQKGLDIERAKRAEEQRLYDDAVRNEGSQSSGPSIPSTPSMPIASNGPSVPTSMPQKTGEVPKFITINTREYDKGAGRFIDKPNIKDNPQWEALNKPLVGEQAGKFSGATQAKSSVQDIFTALKLKPTGNTTEYGKPEYESEVPTGKRIWDKVQQDAAGSTGLILGKNVPILSDIMRAPQFLADQESRDLDNEYQTLAENLLRARTGAAAPEPEIVREMARTFNRLGDDPTTVANRLLNDEEFVDGVIESVRPGYLASKGLQRGSERQPVNQQAPTTQLSDEEAYAKYMALKGK